MALKNSCTYPISLAGWTVKDAATHIYTFPAFTAGPQTEFTLYTGSGTNTTTQLYWDSSSAIWNNDGDTLYLRNQKGELVLQKNS